MIMVLLFACLLALQTRPPKNCYNSPRLARHVHTKTTLGPGKAANVPYKIYSFLRMVSRRCCTQHHSRENVMLANVLYVLYRLLYLSRSSAPSWLSGYNLHVQVTSLSIRSSMQPLVWCMSTLVREFTHL